MSHSEARWPIAYVVAGVFLIVVGITWCCAASAYAGREGMPQFEGRIPGSRRGLAIRAVLPVLTNGVTHLGSIPTVLSHTWNNDPLILQIGFGLAIAVVVGGLLMRVVESQINQPIKRTRRR